MKNLLPKRFTHAYKAQANLPDGSFASIFGEQPLPPSRVQRRIHVVKLLTRHRGQYRRTIKKNQALNVVNPDMKPLIRNGGKS